MIQYVGQRESKYALNVMLRWSHEWNQPMVIWYSPGQSSWWYWISHPLNWNSQLQESHEQRLSSLFPRQQMAHFLKKCYPSHAISLEDRKGLDLNDLRCSKDVDWLAFDFWSVGLWISSLTNSVQQGVYVLNNKWLIFSTSAANTMWFLWRIARTWFYTMVGCGLTRLCCV